MSLTIQRLIDLAGDYTYSLMDGNAVDISVPNCPWRARINWDYFEPSIHLYRLYSPWVGDYYSTVLPLFHLAFPKAEKAKDPDPIGLNFGLSFAHKLEYDRIYVLKATVGILHALRAATSEQEG